MEARVTRVDEGSRRLPLMKVLGVCQNHMMSLTRAIRAIFHTLASSLPETVVPSDIDYPSRRIRRTFESIPGIGSVRSEFELKWTSRHHSRNTTWTYAGHEEK